MLCRIVFCLADFMFSVYFCGVEINLLSIVYCTEKLSCIHRLLNITIALLRMSECVCLLYPSIFFFFTLAFVLVNDLSLVSRC